MGNNLKRPARRVAHANKWKHARTQYRRRAREREEHIGGSKLLLSTHALCAPTERMHYIFMREPESWSVRVKAKKGRSGPTRAREQLIFIRAAGPRRAQYALNADSEISGLLAAHKKRGCEQSLSM